MTFTEGRWDDDAADFGGTILEGEKAGLWGWCGGRVVGCEMKIREASTEITEKPRWDKKRSGQKKDKPGKKKKLLGKKSE